MFSMPYRSGLIRYKFPASPLSSSPLISSALQRPYCDLKNMAEKSIVPAADLESFTEYLGGCKRIVALLGAGISAASGLPTFRGAGGLWRSHDATSLATPEAFDETPGLVWHFYSYRRHMALQADPNKAHYALAELSRRNEDFITLSQNVDGMDVGQVLLSELLKSPRVVFRSLSASEPSLEAAASSSRHSVHCQMHQFLLRLHRRQFH